MHSRYVITEGGGVSLGTSINGLGSRDTEINVFEPDEAAQVEMKFIDPWLGLQSRLYKGEKVVSCIFRLQDVIDA